MKDLKISFKVINDEEGICQIDNVRLSYPNLWRAGIHKDTGERKPLLDSSFLVPLDQKQVAKQINDYIVGKARTITPSIKKMSEIKHPKFEKAKDGSQYVLKTSNQKNRPPVYINTKGVIVNDPAEGRSEDDRSLSPAEKELYAGCYCRIKVQFNPSLNVNKAKVWSNLIAIQWLAHGDRFGGGTMSDEDLQDGFGAVDVPDDFDVVGEPSPTKGKSKVADSDDFDDDLDAGDFDDDLDSGADDEFEDDEFDLD